MTDQMNSSDQITAIDATNVREIDEAVLDFANKMRQKLHLSIQKGRSGWTDPTWTPEQISASLRMHVEKGDPIDVANYCMFLAARGANVHAAILTAPTQTGSWNTGIDASPVPVLYSDCINGSQVMRDDLWLVNTALIRDGERFRRVRSHISGVSPASTSDRLGGFALTHLKPVRGANIMRGSVAQHFDDAVDHLNSGSEAPSATFHNREIVPEKFHPDASHVDPGYRDGYNRAIDDFTQHIRAVSSKNEQAKSDVAVLREIVCDCLAALGNGAGADPVHASIDYLKFAPAEIQAYVKTLKTSPKEATNHIASQTISKQHADQHFQLQVAPWMQACFGPEIASDRQERNHRFFEEATEAVQANGMTSSEAHQLVDYTFNRPVGELHQEVGGVMVTLAALCLASGIDMHQAGDDELQRVWKNIEKIRQKQAAKPKHSPLP